MSVATDTVRRVIEGRSIRWDQARADDAYAQGHWVRETLVEALDRAARTPARPLIIDGEISLSGAVLKDRVTRLASRLVERFPRGSVISFMLPNWHEAAIIYLATTVAGMVVHPILPSLRAHELRFMLEDVGSRIIFIPAELRGHDYVAMMERVRTDLTTPLDVVVVRGPAQNHSAFESLLHIGPRVTMPQVEADAVRLILYTSGTTGAPKGVMHTHNSIHALVRQIGEHWRVAPGDTFLVPSPISHIGGSIYAFEAPLLLGSTAVLMDRWDATAGLELMVRHRCTHMAGATPFLEQLLQAARHADEHLPALKVFICGGASVPPSLIREASAWFDQAGVTRVYGSTEVPVTTIGAPARETLNDAAETDGRAGIADIRLIDDAENEAPAGEVRARGPQMLVGYLHPADEATVFDDQGYYRTGDLGRWANGDCLVISGRAKDIIIRKGENIAPKEIEDVLVTHPWIGEVAVVGVPDAASGERACAVIVPMPSDNSQTSLQPDVPALAAFLRAAGLASFKAPEQVAVWTALPKNEAGKVLKHVIRQELIQAEGRP